MTTSTQIRASKYAKEALKWGPMYFFLVLLALFSLFPIGWMVSTSLKTTTEIYHSTRWIPQTVTLGNFHNVLSDNRIVRSFENSVVIASSSTLITVIIGVLGAYGFARFNFSGRNFFFVSILASQILPEVALVVPFFILLRVYGLTNTYAGVSVVYTVVSLPLAVWMIKGFFDGIPREIEEAAVVDGSSRVGILFRIIVPIAAPAIFAVAMYAFVIAWNEFLLGLVLTSDFHTRPIAVALAVYREEFGIDWGPLMAASLTMAAPAMAFFLYFEKYLIRGLAEGAVKG